MKYSFRTFLAILLCKLLRGISRLLHRGGTAMPGRWALKVCPGLLTFLAQNVTVIAVTGTNGKTTCSRMIEEAFSEAGLDYFANRSGANLISGVTTEFVMNGTLSGHMKKHYAVIECDEAAARTVFGQLKPKGIVVTNLFRDQLDRYGEITHTLSNIREGIRQVPDAVLCLNADCSLTASLADELPNPVLRFGIDESAGFRCAPSPNSDAAHCIRCKTEYVYDYITYAHLGGFRCPTCGYARQAPDFAVTRVLETDPDSTGVMMRTPEGETPVKVNLPAVYNLYNAAAAFAACSVLDIPQEICIRALGSFRCGFGRMENFALGGGAKMMLVKNPAGCTQVLEYLSTIQEDFHLVVCLNDRAADGTDISWIWDANFEALNTIADHILHITVSGDRAADMRLRLKYAGLPDSIFSVEPDYEALVSKLESETLPIYLMPTYTAMLELRSVVVKHCGGSEFWE